ncbi:hypothetical protein M513_11670 [Trichuris suis]|uniref:Uncharacterized protein n=1 Tax=Trichuris suis TaxID=68888 RepID=A0A085LR49_9BILA|nr:hypothetical protein M513_11670 [Trichuris suis]
MTDGGTKRMLLIDDGPSSPVLECLKRIDELAAAEFLPPNATSSMQLMDQAGKDFEGPLLYDSGEPSPIITGLPRPTRSQLYAVFPWRLKTFYTFPKSGGHEHMRGSSSVETISDRASH